MTQSRNQNKTWATTPRRVPAGRRRCSSNYSLPPSRERGELHHYLSFSLMRIRALAALVNQRIHQHCRARVHRHTLTTTCLHSVQARLLRHHPLRRPGIDSEVFRQVHQRHTGLSTLGPKSKSEARFFFPDRGFSLLTISFRSGLSRSSPRRRREREPTWERMHTQKTLNSHREIHTRWRSSFLVDRTTTTLGGGCISGVLSSRWRNFA